MKCWYKKSFGEDYLLIYRHRSREQAKQEINRLIQWLHLTTDDHILDLCCGSGRHAISLAEAGYHVIGIDLSKTLLRKAIQDAQGLPVYFVHGDMRKLPFVDQSFEVVLNLFTSFGYFEKNECNLEVLKEIYRVLKPHGRFCIDFLNEQYLRRNLVPESKRMIDDTLIHEVREIKGDSVIKTLRIADAERERVYFERVKMYTKAEMIAMLKQAGLTVDRIYGDFQGQPYSDDSERMILVGHKG